MAYKKPEMIALAGTKQGLAMSCIGKSSYCTSAAPACHHGPIRR
jgi:hypothetical protein